MILSELKGKVLVFYTGICLIKKYVCLDDMLIPLRKGIKYALTVKIQGYEEKTPHVSSSCKSTDFYLLVCSKC